MGKDLDMGPGLVGHTLGEMVPSVVGNKPGPRGRAWSRCVQWGGGHQLGLCAGLGGLAGPSREHRSRPVATAADWDLTREGVCTARPLGVKLLSSFFSQERQNRNKQ